MAASELTNSVITRATIRVDWTKLIQSNFGYWPLPYTSEQAFSIYQRLVASAYVPRKRYPTPRCEGVLELLSLSSARGLTEVTPFGADCGEELRDRFTHALLYQGISDEVKQWRNKVGLRIDRTPKLKVRFQKTRGQPVYWGSSEQSDVLNRLMHLAGRQFKQSHNSCHPGSKTEIKTQLHVGRKGFAFWVNYDYPLQESSWVVDINSEPDECFFPFCQRAEAYFESLLLPADEAERRRNRRFYEQFRRLAYFSPRWEASQDIRMIERFREELARLLSKEQPAVHASQLRGLVRSLQRINKD